MIEIGRLPNSRAAQAFVDYLKGENIDCQIEPLVQGVAILVIHDKDVEQARQEFAHFIAHPYDNKYLQASWEHGDTQTKLDYGAPSLQLFTQFITGAGPVTLIVFAVCVLIFAAMNLGFANPIYETLSYFGAVSQSDLSQFWRVFTPSLLHFSSMHVIFNLLWWWYLGGRIETRIGTTPLLILLFMAGTLPNIIQYYVSGPNFGGLSGVVYAVVGYTWIMGIRKPAAGIGLPPAYMGFMMIWLALGFTDILGVSVANGAHIGGLFIGLTQGLFDSRKSSNSI
ncbi:rhomboid family intramembrane serine protease GlpG [Shewanella putrefaciens]|uniref:Rhomboid family protein n=1 Tax=Shewanella putrefaciens (strain CN-32 / ATCC BAA-453) TaxID=319224 RepID=A4YCC7_SHEPC|nr:rhomboid family intramembrane serine protease GlpG [Shewanella putrefaciens]QGS48059.1 rhomboid family intramembrane serine protease GlpG [Shewanella putrefaciens]